MMVRRVSRALVAASLLVGVLAGCGESVDLAAAPDPSDNQVIPVPQTLAGLEVKEAKKATEKLKKEAARNSYARRIQVFEMRKGKELRAVLQVIQLAPDAPIEDVDFKRKVFGLIGGSDRRPLNVGGVPVYRDVQNEQYIYLWFHGRFMQVLVVRANATQVGQAVGVNLKTLTAEAVGLRPVARSLVTG